MKWAAIEAVADGVEGWLSVGEGRALFDLAASVPPGLVIVEIGSWKGKSTLWLAAGARSGNGARVYSIDPHTGTQDDAERQRQKGEAETIWSFDDFQRNIRGAGLSDLVTPLVMYSGEALTHVKEPVGLLFIDGDHSYEGVRADFDGWVPRLTMGGVVAFHDTNIAVYPGIKRVVSEQVYGSLEFAKLGYIDSLTYATRVTKASFLDRGRKQASHILRYPDDYATWLHWGILPAPIRKWARRAMTSFSAPPESR